jgi:DNA-binding NtrC family response regulator
MNDKQHTKRGKAATMLLAELEIDPAAATKKITDAIAKAGGNLRDIARMLGIGERTVDRLFAERPALSEAARAAREAKAAVARATREARGGAGKAAAG